MSDRYQKIKELFVAASELSADVRAAFLDQACGDDVELRREVESLLSHQATGPIDHAPQAGSSDALFGGPPPEPQLPETVGPYRIVRRLGQGGMGVVFLGVREEDRFKKRAAVKVLKRGLDTDDVLRRFELERQVLSALNHPNIARLFDAGRTPDGLPYFAMEYVEGLSLTEYADRRKLSINERLDLFSTVCAAVHYAHQNLVVHRDLKPSNIVVSREGVAKLLDFGIAKLLNPELSAIADDPTLPEQRVMTPEYASPEQVLGEPIGTNSDVYSLGVLLYELVSGHRPYRFKSRARNEYERLVVQEDPDRPSTAISRIEEVPESRRGDSTRTITPQSVAGTRSETPDRLRKRVAGDIDNIVMKAMRKEPQRRYASAEQMAADIDRHLRGLPVLAAPDTASYRAIKFVKRNRVGVIAAALVAISLVGGLGAAIWGMSTEREAREVRDRSFAAMSKAHRHYLRTFQDVQDGRPVTESMMQGIRESIQELQSIGADEPEVALILGHSEKLLGDIAAGLRNPGMGDYPAAQHHYQLALQHFGNANDDLDAQRGQWATHLALGDVFKSQDRLNEAKGAVGLALALAEDISDTTGEDRERQITEMTMLKLSKSSSPEQLKQADDLLQQRRAELNRVMNSPGADAKAISGARRLVTVGQYQWIATAIMAAPDSQRQRRIDVELDELLRTREQLAADGGPTSRHARHLGQAHVLACGVVESRLAEVAADITLLTSMARHANAAYACLTTYHDGQDDLARREKDLRAVNAYLEWSAKQLDLADTPMTSVRVHAKALDNLGETTRAVDLIDAALRAIGDSDPELRDQLEADRQTYRD